MHEQGWENLAKSGYSCTTIYANINITKLIQLNTERVDAATIRSSKVSYLHSPIRLHDLMICMKAYRGMEL